MTFARTISSFLLLLALPCGVVVAQATKEPTKPPLAGDAFKNVQVLKDLPEEQFWATMSFFADSLGVNCEHCLIPSIQACGELADQIEHGQPSVSGPRGPQVFFQDWPHIVGIPIRTGGAGDQKAARQILNDLDGAMKIAGKGPLREVCCEDVRASESVDYVASQCCEFHQGPDRLSVTGEPGELIVAAGFGRSAFRTNPSQSLPRRCRDGS